MATHDYKQFIIAGATLKLFWRHARLALAYREMHLLAWLVKCDLPPLNLYLVNMSLYRRF